MPFHRHHPVQHWCGGPRIQRQTSLSRFTVHTAQAHEPLKASVCPLKRKDHEVNLEGLGLGNLGDVARTPVSAKGSEMASPLLWYGQCPGLCPHSPNCEMDKISVNSGNSHMRVTSNPHLMSHQKHPCWWACRLFSRLLTQRTPGVPLPSP